MVLRIVGYDHGCADRIETAQDSSGCAVPCRFGIGTLNPPHPLRRQDRDVKSVTDEGSSLAIVQWTTSAAVAEIQAFARSVLPMHDAATGTVLHEIEISLE